jgi:hypothetical protein
MRAEVTEFLEPVQPGLSIAERFAIAGEGIQGELDLNFHGVSLCKIL